MQSLNLSRDLKELRKHVRQRVRDYPVYYNNGPGDDEANISLITAGYEVSQTGWFALVFDTRQDAKIDGEWTKWIDDNRVEFPRWVINDYSQMLRIKPYDPPDEPFFRAYLNFEYVVESIGEMIAQVLEESLEKQFNKLPLSSSCVINIEEFDGYFEWSSAE